MRKAKGQRPTAPAPVPQDRYPDTREGAITAVLAELGIDRSELEGADVRPDPYVRGCWLVTPRDRTDDVAYLVFVYPHDLATAVEEVEPVPPTKGRTE